MRTRLVPWGALAVAAALFLLSLPVRAGDDPSGEAGQDDEEAVETVSDAEAADLVRALKKVAKKRKVQPLLEVLDRIGLRSHEEFQAPLLKLLTHDNSTAAVRAAQILAVQRVEDEKDREKLVGKIWKEGWSDRDNERRMSVRGAALLAVTGIEKKPLEKDRFAEVERLWKWCVENPDKAWAPLLVSVATYVGRTGDKRMCRWLAEEIDNPADGQGSVDDPNNPPAEWWKRRWEMWHEAKGAVVDALDELTGERFKTTADAKAWFEAHVDDFGFHWA